MRTFNGSPDRTQPRKRRGLLLFGLLMVGVIAVSVLALSLGFAGMMGGSAPQTAQQLASATAGSQVTVALVVTAIPSPTLLTGTLLEKLSNGTYSRTGKNINVKWNSAQVVMGSRSAVKARAILQVSGTMALNDVLTAGQIVILTSFVHIQ
ncbi:MAG: hypothetical protein M3Z08_09675 [Chloroflexota bacterium]|nr:hypothetical protein [Chloroflexota bacterium]